jgi:hypothetical protein
MAIGLVMHFKGVKMDQYDKVMKDMGLTGNRSE